MRVELPAPWEANDDLAEWRRREFSEAENALSYQVRSMEEIISDIEN